MLTLLRPYGFLNQGSAARLMDRVARAIAGDAAAQALLAQPQAQVMSDFKARVKTSGTAAIKSLYWSVRCPDAGAWGGLRTRTLILGCDGEHWQDFPHDPALPALARLTLQPGMWRVLRYVPSRRVTLLHMPPDGPGRIVKVKRPERAADAAHRLAMVNAALEGESGFAIPHLLETLPDGSFALSLCRGAALGAGSLCIAAPLLHRIGRMHATLHRLPPVGLPDEPPGNAADTLALTVALRPDLAGRLAPLARSLRTRPAGSAPVLCHGDLGLDQILHGNGQLSLVDFDRCHAGEAAADMARFLVALAENPSVGLPPDAAGAAYLAGYAEVRTPPAPDRLQWFRAEALAARLLVCLRKDQPLDRLLAAQLPGGVAA